MIGPTPEMIPENAFDPKRPEGRINRIVYLVCALSWLIGCLAAAYPMAQKYGTLVGMILVLASPVMPLGYIRELKRYKKD